MFAAGGALDERDIRKDEIANPGGQQNNGLKSDPVLATVDHLDFLANYCTVFLRAVSEDNAGNPSQTLLDAESPIAQEVLGAVICSCCGYKNIRMG